MKSHGMEIFRGSLSELNQHARDQPIGASPTQIPINIFFQFDDLSRLRGCIRLQDVTLRGNPISRIAKYRDQVRAPRTISGL